MNTPFPVQKKTPTEEAHTNQMSTETMRVQKTGTELADKVRFQVEISKDRAGLIDELRTRCGIESRKELFDTAITLLDWAVSEVEAGRDVASVNREKKEFEVLRMTELTHAARRARGAASR
jgi:hypothetical protein